MARRPLLVRRTKPEVALNLQAERLVGSPWLRAIALLLVLVIQVGLQLSAEPLRCLKIEGLLDGQFAAPLLVLVAASFKAVHEDLRYGRLWL